MRLPFILFLSFFLMVPLAGASPLTTFQVKLVLNNTGADIYIPGVGETTFSGLTPATYASPPHFYFCSYEGGMMVSNVFSYENPISIYTEKSGSTYTLAASMNLTNSRAFLVFTGGDWRRVENRISDIERGDFLLDPLPSFSYGSGSSHMLKVRLDIPGINLTNKAVLDRGFHRMLVENEGETGGMETVSLKKI